MLLVAYGPLTVPWRTQMTLRRIALVLACASGLAWQTAAAHADGIKGMLITGYADRLSLQPGETIRFMVSAELPTYRADIVRLIHGDPNPTGRSEEHT